ncbi:MAG: hypothetical protein QXS54_04830 [Candidatus Methanomethylicaceae archaeon]
MRSLSISRPRRGHPNTCTDSRPHRGHPNTRTDRDSGSGETHPPGPYHLALVLQHPPESSQPTSWTWRERLPLARPRTLQVRLTYHRSASMEIAAEKMQAFPASRSATGRPSGGRRKPGRRAQSGWCLREADRRGTGSLPALNQRQAMRQMIPCRQAQEESFMVEIDDNKEAVVVNPYYQSCRRD